VTNTFARSVLSTAADALSSRNALSRFSASSLLQFPLPPIFSLLYSCKHGAAMHTKCIRVAGFSCTDYIIQVIYMETSNMKNRMGLLWHVQVKTRHSIIYIKSGSHHDHCRRCSYETQQTSLTFITSLNEICNQGPGQKEYEVKITFCCFLDSLQQCQVFFVWVLA
jgi:hypothetical protein